MTMAAHDSSARWRTYLESAKESEILGLLSKQNQSPVMKVDFNELQAFDPDFAEDVLSNPRSILSNGRNTLNEICRERGEDIDCLLRVGELPKDSRRELRDVGSADIERLRSSEVLVTKISEIKPRIHRAVFQCEACGHTVEMLQENERELQEPLRCPPETGCGETAGRGGATRFNLVMNISRMVNNQWIEVQEVPENVPSGAQPSRGQVLVEGDLVNQHLPGERIVVNVIPVVHSEVKRNRKTPMFDIIYHLVSSEHESAPFTEINISDEDREAILEIASRPDLMQLMQRSIAPSIFATGVMHYVKRSLALQLFGGVSRINDDTTRSRGDIHILLMGDPGVAKSQLLNYMSKLSPRGMFASGGGVSGAGLTAAAVRDDFGGGGRFALEAGVLPLSDRGMAAIDEFDKIKTEDRDHILPAMEQQRLSISKGGVKATLNTRCSILAAANPTEGRFTRRGPNESVMTSFKETGLPPPLASRFDIIWMLRDEVRAEDDERIARHILQVRTRGVSETKGGAEIDIRESNDGEIYATGVDGSDHLTIDFLRKYIAYAKRNFHPDVSEDSIAMIQDYYTKERQSFSKSASTYQDAEVIPITPRALEALIRLTEAHAKMSLREETTAEDAKMALAVFRHWREESGIEDESELYSGVSVGQRNASMIVRTALRDLCSERGVAELTTLLNRCESRGLSEFQVEEVVKKMLRAGELFEKSNNHYSFA
tara:strand:+ start:5038 stop:7188 length:2151 start_codon:yes stop_codon:yes gene_type:complete